MSANWQPKKGKKYYSSDDFIFDEDSGNLLCPEGHKMTIRCRNNRTGGYTGVTYVGSRVNCSACKRRSVCSRYTTTHVRQVTKYKEGRDGKPLSYTEQMRKQFDTPDGRSIYSKRMGIVDPVFANIRSTLNLSRFTMRGKAKVNIQWLLYCIVHNLRKIQRYAKL
jgi:hypothetical protein